MCFHFLRDGDEPPHDESDERQTLATDLALRQLGYDVSPTWDAARCLEYGMVNRVVPVSDLDATGEEWAERIVRLPRDGIVMGKAATLVAMESLGITGQFTYGHILHTLATNMRYEPDEFNFMKAKRDSGVTRMNRDQKDHFEKKD